MDPFCDAFISYDNQHDSKLDPLLEPNFSLSSPFSQSSDSTGLFSAFLPKTIQNLLDPDRPGLRRGSSASESGLSSILQNSFHISKQNKEECLAEPSDIADSVDTTGSPGMSEMRDEADTRLNGKSKKITKKEKPKQNSKTKVDAETLLKNADTKFIPDGFYDPNLDEQTKKKMVQMIRNRVAAQNSRDKKKVHLATLQDTNKILSDENLHLMQERVTLLERIQKLEAEKAQLFRENQALKNNKTANVSSKYEPMQSVDPTPPANTQETPTPNGSQGFFNPASSLLSRVSSQAGRFFGFGFSFAFAAVLCLFFFMNGGQIGEGFTGMANMTTTNLMALTKQLMSQLNLDNNQNPEEVLQAGVEAAERLSVGLAEAQVEDFPLLNKIKPLMDQFDRHHENLYQAHEINNEAVINLSQTPNVEQKRLNFKFSNSKNPFLGKKKPVVADQNKTSTLFCPGGFELFRGDKKMDSLFSNNAFANQLSSLGPRTRTLDLEKADYVQLFIPKHSVGRMGVGENSNQIENLPIHQKPEEENSLMEVWCKIFAVRDVAAASL